MLFPKFDEEPLCSFFPVLAQNDFALWEGRIEFEANVCIRFHLKGSDAKKK